MNILNVLAEEWAVRALIASSLVGMMCGVIGSFMVLRNMSLIGDALSHAILPGIFVAFLLVGYSSIGFFVGTLLAAILSAVAITWIQENVNTKNDAAIGIIFTFMFSLGVIGISFLNNQQGVHLDLKDFLFGTILGVSDEDLFITGIITVYSIVSIIIFYRHLFITTFQPTMAQTMGISVKMIHYFLMLLLSFAVVTALRTVGIILVVAMLITPGATALLLTDKLKKVLFLAGLFGLLSAIIGLVTAIMLNTTPGPAMCVIATLFYFLAVFLSPSKGLLFKLIRKRSQNAQIEKEDIIKYIFKMPQEQNVALSTISQDINMSKNKLLKHIKSLQNEGLLLTITLNQRPQLTAKGEIAAEKLVRAHRLWETFLVKKVGLNDTDIHEDAEKYEHLLSPEILDQLDAKLGFPTIDPHGSPIPGKIISALNPLLNLKLRARAKISEKQINTEVSGRLWEMGLSPNTNFQIIDIDKTIVKIKVNNKNFEIPASLAEKINVN